MLRSLSIFLIFFLSESVLAVPRPEYCRELLEQFRELVVLTEKPFSEIHLPEQIVMDVGRTDFTLGFKLYRKYWESGFDRGRFLETISVLANEGRLTTEQTLWLKGVRGRIKRLRNVYVAFDKQHQFPPIIREFSVRIGHIQDGISVGDHAYTVKEAKRFQQFFTDKIERKFQTEIENFEPAKRENFRSWVDSEIADLEHTLKNNEVTSLEFHDSRKVISHFAAMFDSFMALDPTIDNHLIIDYLGSLNEQMGTFHDQLIVDRLSQRIDYNNDKFAFPVPIRSALVQLTERFRNIEWK